MGALLAHDVELTADGGGKVQALPRTLRGRSRVVSALFNYTARLAERAPGASLCPVAVNGGPGALYLDAEQSRVAVCALEIAGSEISNINAISEMPGVWPCSTPVRSTASARR
jgi:RNA polymerase sigma-70 factor (ECF subfamily)